MELTWKNWEDLGRLTHQKWEEESVTNRKASKLDFEIFRTIAFSPEPDSVAVVNAALTQKDGGINSLNYLAQMQFGKTKLTADDIETAAKRAAYEMYSKMNVTHHKSGKYKGTEQSLETVSLTNFIVKMQRMQQGGTKKFGILFPIAEKIIEGRVAASYPEDPSDLRYLEDKYGRDVSKKEYVSRVMSRWSPKKNEQIGMSVVLMDIILGKQSARASQSLAMLLAEKIDGLQKNGLFEGENVPDEKQKTGRFWRTKAAKPEDSELERAEDKAAFKARITGLLNDYLQVLEPTFIEEIKITPEQANEIFIKYYFPEGDKPTTRQLAAEYDCTYQNILYLIDSRIEFLQGRLGNYTPEDLFPTGKSTGGRG